MTGGSILFLCTGNYYRSRFAEELFNHRAGLAGLPWKADSRALAPDVDVFRNPGPISQFAIEGLRARNVTPRNPHRSPASMKPHEWKTFEIVVALSRREHIPMIQKWFPELAQTVRCWEVGDVMDEPPESALSKIDTETMKLMQSLL